MSCVAEASTLEALDVPRLIGALAGLTQTPMGRALIESLDLCSERAEAEQRLAGVAEARALIQAGGSVGLSPARPLEASLRSVAIEGVVLDFDAMVAVYRTAQVGAEVRRRLSGVEELPGLAAMGLRLPDLSRLVTQIESVFDRNGQIRDNASPELASLRRTKRKLRTRVLDALETLVKTDRLDGVLRDRLVTQRGGRYVVPVRAGKRGALAGVVHDTSSSGQTLYVEPLEALDQQNALVEADRAERQEIRRLLADLTGHVRAASAALATTEAVIGELDAQQAKARLAGLMDAISPIFTEGELRLRGGRHPLMIAGVGDAVAGANGGPVPLDLDVPAGIGAVVITGPNTGGKTVVLKTVGMLTVMALSGLPVPATEARLPFSPRVHADIGDEQSIVANLSTFSSHLMRIKRFVDDSPAGSLILLDELGTGTDPAEGAALGIAVLEHLIGLGATILASTHHDTLKAFAHTAPEALNAAMEFDSETLAPTYRIRVGLPGRSNAFDIAQRLGLDGDLVARARGLIGVETAQLDSLIRSVEGEAEALATTREGVEEEQNRLADAHARYEALQAGLTDLRETLATEGKKAVEEALASVRTAGEDLLAELTTDLGETRKARAAQDRRAGWAARIGVAEAEAQKRFRKRLDSPATAAAESASPQPPIVEFAEPAADEVAISEDTSLPLSRGDSVVVSPLNLRGRVARDWIGLPDEGDVEIDVHGKRLLVARRQVRRLTG